MTTSDDAQGVLPIPGLDESRSTRPSSLVAAVRRTIDELFKAGHINPVDVGKVALALELADVIALKRTSGRASTIGNDARVLMEILDAFVIEANPDGDAMLADAMKEWTAYVESLNAATPDEAAASP